MKIIFSECPVCHKKGWYIRACDEDTKLHSCKYCHSSEKMDWSKPKPTKYINATR